MNNIQEEIEKISIAFYKVMMYNYKSYNV